jgi:glycosyltransferase involved in cell wall biosynthesis
VVAQGLRLAAPQRFAALMVVLREVVDIPVGVAPPPPLTIFIIHPSELLTDHLPHGDGTVAWGFIRELSRRGHRLHVACEKIDLSDPPPPNVSLHPIHTRARSGAVHALEYMLGCRSLFERLRRRISFDVAHQLNPVFGGLSLALFGTGVPVVLGSYVAAWPCGLDGSPLVETRLSAKLKRALLYLQQRSAAALLVTTRAALETRIVDTPAIRARVHWQHHGIDAAAFAPAPAARTAALASARILFLANVGIVKGIFPLLEAFARVHALRPDATLVIGGDGQPLTEVRRRIVELGLGDAVDVLGNVLRADVAGLMHGSAVYCLPSFGEPYGMSAIEAMAAGLPLVVTDRGGLAEVADAQGALYVQPGDVEALSDALLTVLASPERARAMGDHNMRRARDVFAWSTVVDSLEAAYAGVSRGREACR